MSDHRNTPPATNRRLAIAGLLLAWSIWGCTASDPSAEETRDPSEVEVIGLDANAPAIEADSVSFYAVVGKDREVEIYFDSAGVKTDRLLRFEVRHDALYRKPDGSRFRHGDSVLIVIRVSDPASLQFDFEPSGLVFDPKHPAELTVGYGRALDAVLAPAGLMRDPGHGNHGGHGGGHSETDLSIWRQEQPNSLFYRLDSSVDTDDKEIEADVPGFSKYAVAY